MPSCSAGADAMCAFAIFASALALIVASLNAGLHGAAWRLVGAAPEPAFVSAGAAVLCLALLAAAIRSRP